MSNTTKDIYNNVDIDTKIKTNKKNIEKPHYLVCVFSCQVSCLKNFVQITFMFLQS